METGERAGAPFQGQRILPAELLKTQRKAQENVRQGVYLAGGAISLLEALVGVQIRTYTPSKRALRFIVAAQAASRHGSSMNSSRNISPDSKIDPDAERLNSGDLICTW
jgi:hypothetical protein